MNGPKAPRAWKTLTGGLRAHLPCLIILAALIAAMTWPALALVMDLETFALPTRNTDVWQKLWDVWHLEQVLRGEAELFYSDAMFHPQGISLVHQNFSLPQMLTASLLSGLLPSANAYSLAYLLMSFAVAASAYLYLQYLFCQKWLALAGAVVFGASQHVLSAAAHPDVGFVVAFPLTLYCFQRGVQESRWKLIALAGLIIGASAWMSVYILICLLLTMALVGLGYALGRWRDGRYWAMLALMAAFALVISGPRVLPILADTQSLDAALSKQAGGETGADLLDYFVNHQHPLTTPLLKTVFGVDSHTWWRPTSYLGYAPLLLIALGLSRTRCRRRILPWLLLALPFLLLRLGSALTIDGVVHESVVLPKALLDQIFPAAFKPFHAANQFQMGLLLPLAVMTCYGLRAIAPADNPARLRVVALAAAAIIAFEYYAETGVRLLPAEQLRFIDWLRTEEESGMEPRLINLPMGRQPAKLYGFYQTLTGYPQVEGLTGRTPPRAYQFIESEALPRAWRAGQATRCFPLAEADFLASVANLAKAGFTHIVWHPRQNLDLAVEATFAGLQAAYRDEYAVVYRLAELRQSCEGGSPLNARSRRQLREIGETGALLPASGVAVLSVSGHQAEPGEALLFAPRFYAPLAWNPDSGAPDALLEAGDAEALASFSFVFAVADPQTAVFARYQGWLARDFVACRPLAESEAVRIELYARARYGCELAVSQAPLTVDYQGGVQLGNVMATRVDDALEVDLLWTRLPAEPLAISLQLFDDAGARAQGADFVIGAAPIARHRLELAGLDPGKYRLMLILYHYESGDSIAGTVAASKAGFERALEIARISLD